MTDAPKKPPSRVKPVKLDEWIAIFVALGTFGSIFFWATTRKNNEFNLLSKPLSEIVSSPDIPSEKSILSLDKPQLKTSAGQSASNPDQASLSLISEELGTNSAISTFITDTVKGIKPNIQDLDKVKIQTKTIPKLVKKPKTTNQKAAPQVANNLIVTETLPVMTSIPTPKIELPQKTETSLPPTTLSSPNISPTNAVKFSDLPSNFWANIFIQPLVERGIITQVDNDKFEPDKPVTRAEFATQIPKVFEEQLTKKSVNYKDIKGDSTAQNEIKTATKSGFLSGYPGNVFRPEQKVSRLQVLISLASGLSLEIPSDPDLVLSVYKDKEEIPDWAKEKIAAATTAGLVVSHPDVKILNPNRTATRAEVAANFYQALVKLGQLEQVSSEYIVSQKQKN
ncbi:MAG: S-layer homology domain-containing protein [Trichodesmium sp. MAG_R04]|nr:S-layer homology domain-containing protein [Trichodesmium sp. MAG_R04]